MKSEYISKSNSITCTTRCIGMILAQYDASFASLEYRKKASAKADRV
jgi:hypothetical protein